MKLSFKPKPMKSILSSIQTSFARAVLLAASALLAVMPVNGRADVFTAGDLALVIAAGSGSNTNCSVVEINTITAAQTAIQTIAIPGSGANAIRVSGSATSTLYVSDSNDGSLLCFTGVNLDGNTTANVNTLNPRAVVTVDVTGTVSIPTTYKGGSGNQTRAATTLNNSFWYIGDQGGFYTNGATAAATSGNLRSVKAFGGTVYSFTASASAPPVNTLSASGTITALPGLPNGATSMQDFYLISSGGNGSTFDVLYILQATGATAGTIYKYSLVSGSWTANGTYTTTFGGFGLCAAKSGSGAALFISTGTGATANNSVIKLTDAAGYNTTIAISTADNVTLYSATSGNIIKGLAFAPASTLAIDNAGTPAAGSIQIGNNNVPVFGFQLSPSGGSANFTALKLTTAGTATSADLSNFQVIYDANNSGTYDAGDSVVSGSGAALANQIDFTITGQTGFSAPRRYLVVADVSGGATAGHTFTGSIAAAGDLTASITTSGTALGNAQTIATAVYDLTMSAVAASESATISSLINDAAIASTSQGAQVWQVTFTNPAGNAGAANISAIAFTPGAGNAVANWQNTIQAAELFDGTTALAAGTISATNIAFSGLSVDVADGASKTLTLRLSLKSTAGALTDNTTFQFTLTGDNVAVSGNGVATASVSSDPAQNHITVVATKLAFVNVPAYVVTNANFSAIVQAQDANGDLDLDDTNSVTITLATGTGALTGGDAQNLSSGTNKWSLAYDTAGTFTLQAAGGNLAPATSGSLTALLAPALTDVFMPQFIQGVASGSSNAKRVPFACRVTLANLIPGATYRYYNQGVISTDSATATGAGNCIFVAAAGFARTTSPGLSSTYGTFTTDASGQYTGWFVLEPTGNTRFATAGNQVFMRIILNDGAGGTSVATRLTTPDSATVLAFNTTGADTGTGIWGNSAATDKNFILLFDNVAGSGQPLAATFAESDGVAENTAASYVLFYNNNVDGIPGAWGAIIPNSNANGIQRIEQRALADGSLVGFSTASGGVWPSGASTVNPSGGDATPIVITAADAPLTGSAPPTVPVVMAIQVTGGNVLIDFTGGTADAVTDFTVLSATNLVTPLTPIAAIITTSGPGLFRATVPVGTPAAFYRIKH
jgi:hypothetical protein